jgi:hypothetical protein
LSVSTTNVSAVIWDPAGTARHAARLESPQDGRCDPPLPPQIAGIVGEVRTWPFASRGTPASWNFGHCAAIEAEQATRTAAAARAFLIAFLR